MNLTNYFLQKIVFVNSTKTTIPAFKIAISWNDEDGYNVIDKIITLFKWMRINAIFEPIEIAGKNYQKFMEYGIDENNLKHLKQNNILVHTAFDYSFFNENKQTNADIYLNIALKNYAIKLFNDKNLRIIQTKFLTDNETYIENIDDLKNMYKIEDVKNCKDIQFDFNMSFGEKYSIFCIKNLSQQSIKNFIIEILRYLNLTEQLTFLMSCKDVDEAIEKLKKNRNIAYQMNTCNRQEFIKIEWKNIEQQNINKIEKIETQLSGLFKISDLVEKIKMKQIKLPDEYELYQIICNNIEYYPNINFWEEIAVNPTVKIRKIEINKI